MNRDDELLKRAWALASLPMTNTPYINAVHDVLGDGKGGVCPRALQMFELATQIAGMSDGGSYGEFVVAWLRPGTPSRRIRRDTAPETPIAIAVRGAAA